MSNILNSSYKIFLLGVQNVGKSSLLHYWAPDTHDLIKVLRGNFKEVQTKVQGFPLNLEIWDFDGKFPARDLFYRSSSAIIAVFDITKRETLDSLIDMIDYAIPRTGNHQIPILLIANKIDLLSRRLGISDAEVEKATRSIGVFGNAKIHYLKTSIRHRENIDSIFGALIPEIVDIEKRCSNCFRVYGEIFYLKEFYFCQTCLPNADIDKAQAFLRMYNHKNG